MILACPFCQTKVQKTERTCHLCNRVMTRHCPYCSEDISVLANLCKYCGEAVEPIGDERPLTKPAVLKETTTSVSAAPEVEFLDEVKYCAWEDPSKRGVFRRWWSTWKDSQFSPASFWQKLPTDGGFGKAYSYAWMLVVQSLILFAPFAAFLGLVIGVTEHAAPVAYAVGVVAYLALFPLSYVFIVVGNFIASLFWHLLLKVLGGRGTFQGTLRIVSYNAGAGVWGLIPLVGGIVQGVMTCVGHYHAFRNIHQLSKGRALFATLLPIFLCVVATVALIVVFVACASSGCFPSD